MTTRLQFVNVAWGRPYLRSLTEQHLPSVLTPGNLSAVAEARPCSYVLYTTREQIEWLDAQASIQAVRRLMPLRILAIEDVTNRDLEFPGRYRAMNDCHRDAVSFLEPDEAASFLAPDMIWGDGSLKHVSDLLEQGKRVVVAPGVRLSRAPFVAARERLPFVLSNRELVRLAMRHLHPTIRASFWDGPRSNVIPSNLLWRAPRGLIVHGYQLHPVLVWPTNPNVLPTDAVDGWWLHGCCPEEPESSFHLIQDSDDHVCFELSPEGSRCEFIVDTPQSVSRMVKWAEVSTVPLQRWWSCKPIRLHYGDVTEEWRGIEERAAAVLCEIAHYVAEGPKRVSTASSLTRIYSRLTEL